MYLGSSLIQMSYPPCNDWKYSYQLDRISKYLIKDKLNQITIICDFSENNSKMVRFKINGLFVKYNMKNEVWNLKIENVTENGELNEFWYPVVSFYGKVCYEVEFDKF